MSNPIVSQSETKHNTPDAAACVDREQRQRKMEQDINDLFGIETPVSANYHAPLRSGEAGQEAK